MEKPEWNIIIKNIVMFVTGIEHIISAFCKKVLFLINIWY